MPEARIQRRLAAIMAIDVVGFSRLMGADEVGTLARLKALRANLIDPRIAEYQGRIVKEMGDGLLVEFASIIDAVQCADDVQTAMAERAGEEIEGQTIALRIGINLGDIIAEGDDIFGDGVNIAARLEGLAKPGGICISGSAHDQIRQKLDLVFEFLGAKQVKNIAEPVRAYSMVPGRAPSGLPTSDGAGANLPAPNKPSVAVLPFDNMSGDAAQDYFADGITEDIITELSRFSELFVIARNSSFTYKGRPVKVQDVGVELGVRYVVEGSVRKAGDRVRVNVQLIDSSNGNHIWADRYDRELADIFEVQDELTQRIVASVSGRVDAAEKARVKRQPPDPMAALDYLLAGKIHHHRVTPEDNAEALRLLEMAIDLDPDFAEAHAWKACTMGQALEFGFAPDPEELESRALAALDTALSLDEDNVECHRLLCEVYMSAGQLDRATTHGARAIGQNPNDPRLVAQQGELLTWLGRPLEGIEWVEKAMRLDPHGRSGRAHLLGRALYGARRYEDAIEAIAMIAKPRYGHCAFTAASHGQLDRPSDAATSVNAVLKQKPDFSVVEFVGSLPYAEQADRDHLADGLRKGGLPG